MAGVALARCFSASPREYLRTGDSAVQSKKKTRRGKRRVIQNSKLSVRSTHHKFQITILGEA